MLCSGFATGIYATNLPDACKYVADHAKCNIIVVENDNQLQKIRKVWDQLPDLKAVIHYKDIPTEYPNVYSVCNNYSAVKLLYANYQHRLYSHWRRCSIQSHLSVCLFVRTLKATWLELSTPNFVHVNY